MQINKVEYFKLFADHNCWERFFCFHESPASNTKSSEELLKEMQHYLFAYKIGRFEFIDVCNRNPDELEKLCDLIVRENLLLKWSAPAVPDPRMDYGIIDKMHKAGCEKLIFSLFTGSDAFLRRIRANFTMDDVSRILMLCHKVGIATGIDLIFGHPQETEEDFYKTYKFLDVNRSFIDEITRIRYCPNHIYSTLLGSPLCHHWMRCAGNNKKAPRLLLIDEFINCASKISTLNIPIKYCEQRGVSNIDKCIVVNKELCFLFDNGKGRIFWKDKELTSGLGLYASIFAKALWQDSAHATWQVTKVDEKKIIAKGRWHLLPLIQIWDIELSDDSTISIQIYIETQDRIVLEGEQQINIMLRNEYTKWSSDDNSNGFFTDRFNRDWETLFEKDISLVNVIRAETDTINKGLPPVSLKQELDEGEYRMSILNTSSDYNARILKCYKIDGTRSIFGGSIYFTGEIRIN